MLNKEEKAVVFEALKGLSAVFETNKTKEVLSIYVESMSEFKLNQILQVIKWAINNCTFFPKPAELIKQLNPSVSKEEADLEAGTIISYIAKYGWNQGSEVKNRVSTEGWQAIQNVGGWTTLCETKTNQLSSLRAQLRDACLAEMKRNEIEERKNKRLQITGSKKMDASGILEFTNLNSRNRDGEKSLPKVQH